jgi:2-polyprenyl-6-methoxyphenol hydroxylase-like FAD-dependent oxidoreductase
MFLAGPSYAKDGGSRSNERVVVIGGGMGGLATALALENSGREIVIVERDPPPPELAPADAFEAWERPGVPQFHHTHIFLSRTHTLLRHRHPRFLAELEAAGILSCTIDEVLPPMLLPDYVEEDGDRDLLPLWGRRATFEYVLRRYVGRLPGVKFVHGARVESLATERDGDRLRVTGVRIRHDGIDDTLHAAIVVDASGVRTKCVEWLKALGARIRTEVSPSPCTYYCRHFRRTATGPEPPRHGTGATVDYLVFGMFFAEENTYSIAFACPETETELSEILRRPEGFDHVCSRIPVLHAWTAQSEPISRVLGGAALQNRWHHYAASGKGQVLGFFPLGDSHIQTNPIYGRGCSSAFVQAEALADVLAESGDAVAHATRYHNGVLALMKAHFGFSLAADRALLGRARLARGDGVALGERVTNGIFESVLLPAVEGDVRVAREWLKAQQMREASPFWVTVGTLLRLLYLWVLRAFQPPRAARPRLGPTRGEMHATLPPNRTSEVAGAGLYAGE